MRRLLAYSKTILMVVCLLGGLTSAFSQSKIKIRGSVTDVNGEPLIAVQVIPVGAEKFGGLTDLNGAYSLTIPSNVKTLTFSYIGYQSKHITISKRKVINVVLEEDNKILEQVVVTALGIKRSEKALSYSVQELKGDVLSTNKDANFINSLDGRVAGVTINKSASGIGGATRVIMRGVKSIEGSNGVLYVIDGMPIYNTSTGTDSGIMEGKNVGSEGIADFNPDDIASISVLSGPSAAALYGSSAANGAILITTKKGKEGKLRINLSSSFEMSTPFIMPRFQNTYGNKAGSFESWGDKLKTPSTYDPRDDFFQLGTSLMNNVALTFGTKKNQTYISIGTANAGGIVPNNAYKRYNFNLNNTLKLFDDKLSVTLGAQYIYQKDRNMVSQGQYFNPIVAAYLFPRGESWEAIKSFERYDPTRKINIQYWPVTEGVFGVQNPYWTAYRNINENQKDRYIFTVNSKYDILDWLNIAGRFRFDKSYTHYHRDLYASTNEKWAGKKGAYLYSDSNDQQLYGDLLLNVDKRLGDFSIVGNLGASFSDFKSNMAGYGGNLQLIPNMFTIGNINPSEGAPREGGGDLAVRNIAAFASLEVGWNRMLYLSMTGRNDWNSRLVNSVEPSFFYPSVGLSGIISEMVDMGKLVDLLKIRASYTQVGAPVSRIGLTPGTYTDKIEGGSLQPSTIYPYGDFKAERTTSYEVGLNFKGLKGLSLDLTLYKSNTYNQTFIGVMPESSGYTHAYLQAGNVQNKGIEAALGYRRELGDFKLSSNVVFSMNKNEIISMVENYKHPSLDQTFNIDEVSKGNGRTILKVGGSINDIYANKFLKKDGNGFVYIPETGEIQMEAGKPVYLGHTDPDFTLGWSNSFAWRGLSLSFTLNGRFGGVVTSSTQAILDRFGVSEASAIARDNGGVLIPHQGRYDAKAYYENTAASGEFDLLGYYTYDATNVRLGKVSLAYRLPDRLFKGKVKGVTLSLTGNNLLMLYNKAPYDPELTSSTGTYGIGNDYFMQPSLRSFGASLKLSL